jgi:hypothetical protein
MGINWIIKDTTKMKGRIHMILNNPNKKRGLNVSGGDVNG